MSRIKKNFPTVPIFPFIFFVVAAAVVFWFLIPSAANDVFGQPTSTLTSTQKFEYSSKVLIHKQKLTSPTCSNGTLRVVNIELGDSVNAITQKLYSAGLIDDTTAFRDYLIYKGLDTKILAGKYTLSCTSAPIEIAFEINNHQLVAVPFNILPGWRAEEIAAALPSSGLRINPDEFLAIVQNPAGIQVPGYIPAGSSLEGFLFPGEYEFDRSITAQQMVQILVSRFDQEVISAGINTEDLNGLTFYQRVILASIVQRETYDSLERPLMASVFYNRLKIGMNLETDPTVQYALGYNTQWGWWKSPLNTEDLSVQSSYNTYINNGLPPAPISNPDLTSLLAVQNPESSDYYFFRAKCDNSGSHIFAKTLDEQIANACK